MSESPLTIRPYAPADEQPVLELLQASLGWVPDEQYAAFFAWKHYENSFGRSFAWVASDEDRIVGFRTFLRWEFVRDGDLLLAVRAVDTATHPQYQGRGIFSQLTLHGIEEVRAQGVSFVFNTPNDKSRPGYLKMGWEILGQLPVAMRPRSLMALPRLLAARVAADKWSTGTEVGIPAREVLEQTAVVEALLASQPAPAAGRIATRKTPDYLRWRYGFAPLGYRVLPLSGDLGEGFLVFRVRRRGGAVEAGVCELVVPGGDLRLGGRLVKQVLAQSGADYAAQMATDRKWTPGSYRMPGQGPMLAWRRVGAVGPVPSMTDFRLQLGDVELF
jgi:GNAT superfamily N-acetyltransferase